MAWLNDAKAEIMTLVSTTWPDCGGRVFTSLQMAREAILESIDAGRVSLPLAIVRIGATTRDDAHGMHNRSYRLPVAIVRVVDFSDTVFTDAAASLDTLALQVERTKHVSFRAIETGEIDLEEMNAALTGLLAAKANVYAAALNYQPGLLSGAFAT